MEKQFRCTQFCAIPRIFNCFVFAQF